MWEGEEALAGDLLLQAGLCLGKRQELWDRQPGRITYLSDDDNHYIPGR